MSDWTSANAEVPILLDPRSRGTADFSQGEVHFIDKATTLIRFGELTLVTGPASLHKGEHAFWRHGITCVRREVEPPCQIADLPPIDLAVLSHYHGDHFDGVAAGELDKTRPIASTPDAVHKLTALGFKHGWLPVRLRRNQ